jgi:peptide/nickel transport system ATP-binding protein
MTEPRAGARPPATGAPLLEARNLTRHFPVYRGGQGREARLRAARTARAARGTRGARSGANQAGGTGGTGGTGGRPVVHAVDGVSLALPAARVTAVVGESGSGKSTLARLLARLLKPTGGELLLDGQPVPRSAAARRRYARQVQLVLQDPFSSLNPVHDVRYHLARPLLVHGMASRGGLDAAIGQLLERVALSPADQFVAKYPHELSGGQRQRVAIARALAVQPRVLLADEPVSMLDVSIRLDVLNLLGDLRDREGLAILYITHDIASARYLAETIVVMYAGQVVESGPSGLVTDAPAHPYTQLLLSAAPDPAATVLARQAGNAGQAGPNGSGPVLAGRGSPPSLITPPSGCRFHPRCPHAMAVCTTTAPQPAQVAAGHLSACWLHAAGLSPAQSRPAESRPAQARPAQARPAQAGPLVPDPGEER